MEPKIYKPGAYNTPGVYNGAGGIYNGRGVYNDGATPPPPPPLPDNLVFVNYFSKNFGETPTTGNVLNWSKDLTCPLNVSGGAPIVANNEITSIEYNTPLVNQISLSRKFTFEFFGRMKTEGTQNAPFCGMFQSSGNYWQNVISLLGSQKYNLWINDNFNVENIYSNYYNWKHFELSANGTQYFFFINGYLLKSGNFSAVGSWFRIFERLGDRSILEIAQVALWDICLHESNFNVDYEPIINPI